VARVAAEPSLRATVKVTECGCLGPCFDGPNAVVYPDGTWYAGLSEEDAEAIVQEHLLTGNPVAERVLELDDDDEA